MRKLSVQSLEERCMMAANVFQDGARLYVIGDQQLDNDIVVTQTGEYSVSVVVQVGGVEGEDPIVQEFDNVNIMTIIGGEGNDSIINDTAIRSIIRENAGDNTLIGGSNKDIIIGGSGFDTIYGRGDYDMILDFYASPNFIDGGDDHRDFIFARQSDFIVDDEKDSVIII